MKCWHVWQLGATSEARQAITYVRMIVHGSFNQNPCAIIPTYLIACQCSRKVMTCVHIAIYICSISDEGCGEQSL